jgi:hypothetical protein
LLTSVATIVEIRTKWADPFTSPSTLKSSITESHLLSFLSQHFKISKPNFKSKATSDISLLLFNFLLRTHVEEYSIDNRSLKFPMRFFISNSCFSSIYYVVVLTVTNFNISNVIHFRLIKLFTLTL